MGLPRRRRRTLMLGLAVLATAARAAGDPGRPAEILVRLRDDGPHAVIEDAADRHRRGRPLAEIARDGSDSLDRLNAQLGVREVRAVFRRSDGRALAASRAELAKRAQARRAALPSAIRAALPAVPDLAEVYRLTLPPGADAAAAAARYAADPHVAWAQVNTDVAPDRAANDPYLSSSGSWGQSYADLWGILRVRAPEAWDVTQGEGIIVAVVDTGIDPRHPDLAPNIWVNPGEDLNGNGEVDPSDYNGVDDDGNGFVDDLYGFDFASSIDANGDGDFEDPGDVSDADPFDDDGHGTHIAGTIAAVANNGIGVAGVAPRARLMAVKGLRATGSTPIEVFARAMVYAADNGARVINNSSSCSTRCPSNPILEEAQAYATSLGAVVVSSAGNKSDDVVFYSPKQRRDNIVVGSTDDRDHPSLFTNTGFLVSVVAPGSGEFFANGVANPERAILSTLSSGAGFDATGNGAFVVGERYLRWAGTSMSAPHVSGIAALILSLHPDYLPDEVRAVIRSSARDLGRPGHDRTTGAGLADAARAVASPRPAVRALFSAPAPGAVVAPAAEAVTIRGQLIGAVAGAALSVGFGRNPAVFDLIPLATPLPDAEGELARWDVSARDDGPYVLKLEVRAADGTGAVEFLPVSLERNAFTRLSSPGEPARSPSISGGRVVWESARPDGEVDLGLELFVHDWTSGEEWRAVSGPGDQHAARLSGDRLAWIDARDHTSEIASCRLTGSQTPCREQVAGAGPERRDGLSLSDATLVWSEGAPGSERLRGCRFVGGRCPPLALPPSTARQRDPVLSGARLWWSEVSADGFALFTCVGFPEQCAPAAIGPVGAPYALAGSAALLAWSDTGDPTPFYLCRASGQACPPRLIGTVPGGELHLAVSGDRVVWSAPGPGGDRDVYWCEDDPLTGQCPIQRLTGSAADQRNPDISGTRVVWEDDRDGTPAIEGFELPSLDPVPERSANVGQPLRIAVRGRDPAGGALTLAAAFADGTPLSERGAAFRDRGDGTAVLSWTPRADDVGSHVVTFAGRTEGRLTARTSVRIEVAQAVRR